MSCLALKSDGTVWSWGYNGNGNVGDGTLIDRWEPAQVKGLANVTAIYGGSFAIKDDGAVWTWGDTIRDVDGSGKPIDYQVLGDHTKLNCKPIPFQVQGINDVKVIDVASHASVVFVKNDSTVWSWGYNMNGSLGDGSVITNNYPFIVTPVQAKDLTDVNAVSASYGWSMALKNDGTVWTWGYNNGGQFGNGKSYDIEPKPVEVTGLDNVKAISSKNMHSVFLKNDGSIWTCGNNYDGSVGYGPVGLNAIVSTPVKILGPDDATLDQTNGNPINSQNASQNINNSTQPDNASPTALANNASANNIRLYLDVLGLAIIILAAGCLIYLTLIRKKR